MKKVLQWIGIFLGAVGGYVVIKYGIPLMFAVLLVIGMEHEWDSLNDPSEQALQDIGVSDPAAYATWADLTINGVMTAFEVRPAALAGTEGWSFSPITTPEYARQLEVIAPEAAFLRPADELVFDAVRYAESDQTTWFDQDTGLLIHIRLTEMPTTTTTRIDSITVPTNGWMYELESHGGFLGDGTTYRAFIVPEAERPALEAMLSTHADWHAGAVTHAEYVHLHDHEFYSVPELYPADDVTFDWWCYVDTYARAHPDFDSEYTPDNSDFPAVMREAGAGPAGNWLVALYDADTGLFIYYEYDS